MNLKPTNPNEAGRPSCQHPNLLDPHARPILSSAVIPQAPSYLDQDSPKTFSTRLETAAAQSSPAAMRLLTLKAFRRCLPSSNSLLQILSLLAPG